MLRERLAAQLLAGPPARDPVAVVARITAVQAQDARGARLAIRARSAGLVAADVDRALGAKELLITWLNRGTLHLVRREDYAWLHAVTTPSLRTANATRLGQEGVPPDAAERAVGVVTRTLADEGPLSRARLRDRVTAQGVRTEGQALVHVLFLASLRGLIVRGPVVDGEHAYVLAHDWLGARDADVEHVDRDRALAELARRYLAGHAPATARDLARWAGIGLRDARAGLEAIAPELDDLGHDLVALAATKRGSSAENRDEAAAKRGSSAANRDEAATQRGSSAENSDEAATQRGSSAAKGTPAGGAKRAVRRPAPPKLPAPRLLGAFDPVLHGWTSRDDILAGATTIVTKNGIFRPFALAEGRAVATWTMPRGRVALDPFAPLDAPTSAALAKEAADVERFLAPGG